MINISIIIPTHNRGYIIKQCIDSILNQSYKDFELIIVDDHSNDNTFDILNNINDTRLKILELNDKYGAQAARNEGIRNATGDWICFNDSDDLWKDNKLEIHLKNLRRLKYDKSIAFYTDCYRYEEDTNNNSVWNLPKINYHSSYKSLLSGPGPMLQGLFCNKEIIINCGLLDESVPSYQEWDTSLILAKSGVKFYHIKEPLFTYNIHSGSTISKDIIRDFNGYHYIITKYKDDIINYCGFHTWNKHIIYLFRKILANDFLSSIGISDKTFINNIDFTFNEINKSIIKYYYSPIKYEMKNTMKYLLNRIRNIK